MRVLATTVHRVASPTETHGFLLEIDWRRKEVLRLIEAPPLYSQFEKRNRGGRRGLRGITRFAGLIWFASCDALFGLEPQSLCLERIVTHPWMAHIHEIEAGKGGIWVTSTGGNGIFQVGLDQQALQASWLCGEPDVDLRVYLEKERDRYHVNTVFESDSKMCAYAHTTGQVFQMLPLPVTEVAVLEEGCHNVTPTEFGWFRNDSRHGWVRVGDRKLKMPRRGIAGEFTQPAWLRGMARLPNGNFLVGSSPASLYEIDPRHMRIVDRMYLTDDVGWTIHGIFVDNEHEIVRPADDEIRDARRRFRALTAHAKWQHGLSRLASRVKNKIGRYLSDNGVSLGEHRVIGRSGYVKRHRVPFAICYPPLIPKPRVEMR